MALQSPLTAITIFCRQGSRPIFFVILETPSGIQHEKLRQLRRSLQRTAKGEERKGWREGGEHLPCRRIFYLIYAERLFSSFFAQNRESGVRRRSFPSPPFLSSFFPDDSASALPTGCPWFEKVRKYHVCTFPIPEAFPPNSPVSHFRHPLPWASPSATLFCFPSLPPLS